MMVAEFIFRSSCKINGWCILALSGSIWKYLTLHPQGEKLSSIAFISTTECGVIKKWEISLQILKEELVVEGGKIRHHESQIASGVTDNQNTIRILIMF